MCALTSLKALSNTDHWDLKFLKLAKKMAGAACSPSLMSHQQQNPKWAPVGFKFSKGSGKECTPRLLAAPYKEYIRPWKMIYINWKRE